MSTFCPICGDPLSGEAHDCPSAGPGRTRALPRFPIGPSPIMVRARIEGLDPPRPAPAPGKAPGAGRRGAR